MGKVGQARYSETQEDRLAVDSGEGLSVLGVEQARVEYSRVAISSEAFSGLN